MNQEQKTIDEHSKGRRLRVFYACTYLPYLILKANLISLERYIKIVGYIGDFIFVKSRLKF